MVAATDPRRRLLKGGDAADPDRPPFPVSAGCRSSAVVAGDDQVAATVSGVGGKLDLPGGREMLEQ